MTDEPGPQAGPYIFTNGWFAEVAPIWRQIVQRDKPVRILEIGSFEGQSTCWMIENCTAAAGCDIEITCVDSWEGGIEHKPGGGLESEMLEVEQRFDANIAVAQARAPHRATIRKMRRYSFQALGELITEGKIEHFDLVYIDASHEAPDVLIDAAMAFLVLRLRGIMIFDDYLWSMDPPGAQDVLRMPKPAIDAFMNIFQRKMSISRGLPIGQLYAHKIGR